MTLLNALPLVALLSVLAQPAQADDAFASQLDYLRRQNFEEVGRPAMVASYEKFIEQHQADPRVADAMIDVAGMMEVQNPKIGAFPDRASALQWFRKAADTAPQGTPLWTKAQFMFVNRVWHEDAVEARKILQTISSRCSEDSLALARVEVLFMQMCIKEHELKDAESHCRRGLRWYADPKRVPTDGYTKWELDNEIRSASSGMMAAYVTAPFPKAERARLINNLMKDNPVLQPLIRDGMDALKRLETMPEYHPPVLITERPIERPAGNRQR